jgi:probable HAF family extracellular repeat protein
MALVEDRDVRGRGRLCTLVTGAVVFAAFAVASSGPAWGQETGDADEAPAANTSHAFLLDDGQFITIDPPGASGALTAATGINDREQIVGYYLDADGTLHGFLRKKRGIFTPIDHPDAPTEPGVGTVALDINNRGQIVGAYVDAEQTTHGFLLDDGIFTTIDPPGASFTEATGIDDRGQIVGPYLDAEGTVHGFLRDKGRGARRGKGVFTTIELPGALATSAEDLNNRGQIVGNYSEVGNTRPLDTPRAYLLDDGDFNLIDAFGADCTLSGDINDRGEIVGSYLDAGGPALGFLRDKRAVFTTIDVPGAEQTAAVGNNNRGQIVGAYVDAGGTDPIFVCGPEGSAPPSMSQASKMTPPPGSGMGEAMLP